MTPTGPYRITAIARFLVVVGRTPHEDFFNGTTFQSDFRDPGSNRRVLLQTTSLGQGRQLTSPCPPSPTHTLREGINVRFTAAKEFKKIQITIFTCLANAQQNHVVFD
jgi:hypothetical protein